MLIVDSKAAILRENRKLPATELCPPALGRCLASLIRYNPPLPAIETSIPLNQASSSARVITGPRAFSSFANGDFRIYFLSATAAMMADNIEHVITYWVMFQKFHSAALGGFAVV